MYENKKMIDGVLYVKEEFLTISEGDTPEDLIKHIEQLQARIKSEGLIEVSVQKSYYDYGDEPYFVFAGGRKANQKEIDAYTFENDKVKWANEQAERLQYEKLKAKFEK